MAEFPAAPLTDRLRGQLPRKDLASESLPVTSRLLPARLRPHITSFYGFARLAKAIADEPHMEPEGKLAQLDALERALLGGDLRHGYLKPVLALRSSLRTTGVSDRHARHMLQAFRRDALGVRCRTWSDLLLHCRYAATPVGRYLLELHAEGETALRAADALCTAVQVSSHVQNCRLDWIVLGRRYLPLAWFEAERVSEERLMERGSTPEMRAVLNRALDQVDKLLVQAEPLPAQIGHRGLRLEASVMLSLTHTLVNRLRRRDPLRRRVALSPAVRLAATARGITRGLKAAPPRS